MSPLWDASVNIAIRDALGPLVPVLEVLTHAGDGAVLLVIAVLVYWFGAPRSRRDRVFVIAIGIAALALSAGLKGVIQMARPELAFTPAAYPGYSFPSAHAMGAAAVYGALAVTTRSGRRWQRYLAVGVVIFLVSLSRVVMGVHFVGDVVVGAILGVALVGLGLQSRKGGKFEPRPIFLLAVAISILSLIAGSRTFAALTIGASLGGVVGWWSIAAEKTTDSGAAVFLLGGIAVGALLLARLLSLRFASYVSPTPPGPAVLIAEIAAYAGLTWLVLYLPALAVHVEDHPVVERLQGSALFRGRKITLRGVGR